MPADPACAVAPVVYVECDVPDGMTLAEWRRRRDAERAAPQRRSRLRLPRRRR
jgi:hypothetical protein